jgi:hypothetical protein
MVSGRTFVTLIRQAVKASNSSNTSNSSLCFCEHCKLARSMYSNVATHQHNFDHERKKFPSTVRWPKSSALVHLLGLGAGMELMHAAHSQQDGQTIHFSNVMYDSIHAG